MSTKKRPNPFGKLQTDVDRYADLREERDAALKTAAVALAALDAAIDSDVATQADAAQLEYEGKVELLFDLAKVVTDALTVVVAESRSSVLASMDPKAMPQA
jgi:hypothetical protein